MREATSQFPFLNRRCMFGIYLSICISSTSMLFLFHQESFNKLILFWHIIYINLTYYQNIFTNILDELGKK